MSRTIPWPRRHKTKTFVTMGMNINTFKAIINMKHSLFSRLECKSQWLMSQWLRSPSVRGTMVGAKKGLLCCIPIVSRVLRSNALVLYCTLETTKRVASFVATRWIPRRNGREGKCVPKDRARTRCTRNGERTIDGVKEE